MLLALSETSSRNISGLRSLWHHSRWNWHGFFLLLSHCAWCSVRSWRDSRQTTLPGKRTFFSWSWWSTSIAHIALIVPQLFRTLHSRCWFHCCQSLQEQSVLIWVRGNSWDASGSSVNAANSLAEDRLWYRENPINSIWRMALPDSSNLLKSEVPRN